jgi:hypothetical protein
LAFHGEVDFPPRYHPAKQSLPDTLKNLKRERVARRPYLYRKISRPMSFRILFCAVIALTISACGDRVIDEPEAPDTSQYNYFPLRIGQYAVYSVDSIIYDFAQGGGTLRDSFRTFVREVVGDTLRDQTGVLLYRIERYERRHDTAAWVLKHIGTASRTATQAIRTEDNLRFLKLVFPLDRRSEWDGNLWIDENREIEIAGERVRPFVNWEYEVDSIDVPAVAGAFAFDSTLLVTEVDDKNIIERRLSRVRYAKNVGVVWREQWILDSQYCNQSPPPADCETRPWELKAEKGYILRQTIIEFN